MPTKRPMATRAPVRAVVLVGVVRALTALSETASPHGTGAAPAAEAQHVTLCVLPSGSIGPDGRDHDTPAPSDFVLHRDVPVTFTIINYDDDLYTFYAPALDLAIAIAAGTPAHKTGEEADLEAVRPTTTTFTFTPRQQGEFRWQCAVMRDAPSRGAIPDDARVGHDGFLAGWIKVL
jgi:heme/copper-type cytochrome/quinol oxidase subunit 2